MAAKKPRQLVVIASTMRSGSTLLKALLASAPDVSDLPEVNFQRWTHPRFASALEQIPKLASLASERILVLKRPAWYQEISRYPQLPAVTGTKTIVLLRDPYDTVQSLRKMMFGFAQQAVQPLVDRWLLTRYWLPVTQHLLQLAQEREHRPAQVPTKANATSPEFHIVRYENLVNRPIPVTRDLFRFIGSDQQEGVDTYQPPAGRRWKWGSDDNSTNIRSLQVKPPRPRTGPPENGRLQHWIDADPTIQQLLAQLKQLQPNLGVPI